MGRERIVDEIRNRLSRIEFIFKKLEELYEKVPEKSIPILYVGLIEEAKDRISVCKLHGIENKEHLEEEKDLLESFKDDVINAARNEKMDELLEELHYVYSVGETLLLYLERKAGLKGKEINELTDSEAEELIKKFHETVSKENLKIEGELSYLLGVSDRIPISLNCSVQKRNLK